MKLHELAPKVKKQDRIRRGQGDGSGHGSFSGKGCNGQNCRAGGGVRLGFEGGQSGLLRRMPKNRGFRNPNRVESQVVTLTDLDENFKAGEEVTIEALVVKKVISGRNCKVKVLANGELTKKLTFADDVAVSKAAQALIDKA